MRDTIARTPAIQGCLHHGNWIATGIKLATCLALLFVWSTLSAPGSPLRSDAKPVVIADFESRSSLTHWSGLACERTTAHAASGRYGLRFGIPKWSEGQDPKPGVRLSFANGRGFPLTDWTPFQSIVAEAWIEGDAPGVLAIKAVDRDGEEFWPNHVTLQPGKWNSVEMIIPDAAADANRTQVEQLVFYSPNPTNSFNVVVDNIRLLPLPPPPMAHFHLAYPNYRDWIFPEATNLTVECQVEAQAHHLRTKNLQLQLTLRAPGVERTQTWSFGPTNTVRGNLSPAGLAPGLATLEARLIELPGNRLLSNRVWQLRQLAPAEAAQLDSYIDQNNTLIVQGKPFFPIGWYGQVNETQTLEIAQSPFNCLLAYGTDKVPKDRMLPFLNLLHTNGMKLIYCLNDVYPTATYLEGKTWEGVSGNDAIADAVITAYKDHPAILAWYLNDEIPHALAPKLEAYYHRVRTADPHHPCLIVICNLSEMKHFPTTTDIFGVDPYPIPQKLITQTSGFVDGAQKAVRGSQSIWMVAQTFGWYQYHSTENDRGHIPTAEELKTERAPTPEEERCMTYLGLIHGAKGLLYYCYYDFRVLPQYAQMWPVLKSIAAEVQSLAPALLSPEDPGVLKWRPATAPIQATLRRHGNRLFLLAANPSAKPCEVRFQLTQSLPAQIQVLFELRTLPAKGKEFRDQFEPLAVHVYEIPLAKAAR